MAYNNALKRVLAFVLALAMFVTLLPQRALATTSVSGVCTYGDWSYRVITDEYTGEKTIRICEYKGTDTEVTVPATIDVDGTELVVTSTYNSAYSEFRELVTKVTFQEGFKKVGERTCQRCSTLEEVVLPDSVEEIQNSAFFGCALTEVKLPANLKKIDSACVFEGNTNLTSVDFSACTQLTEIGTNAFAGTGLTSLDLSACNALTTIGDCAFQHNPALISVTLPESSVLTNIGKYAFQHTGITGIDMSKCTGLTKISDRLFSDCTSLSVVTLPDTVTEIGVGAFYKTSITSFDFDVILEIGNDAFKESLLAGSFTAPIVTSIGNEAFKNTNITKATVSSSVTQMGERVFWACKSLEEIDMSASTLETVPAGICQDCSNLVDVKLNDSMTGIGSWAFYQTGITTISLPSALQTIEKNSFAYTKLTALELPDSVTTICNDAFCNNNNLVDVRWPLNNDFTTVLGFDNCVSLSSDVIKNLPASVTTIGEEAFKDCRFTELQLPESVITISKNAFSNTNITKLLLADSVTTICEDAFAVNTSLEEIKWPDNVEFTTVTGFNNCSKLDSDVIENLPSTVTTIGKNAFARCGIKELTLPESVVTIGENAFMDNKGLTTVTTNANLRTIGKGAFIGCSSLANINLTAGVRTISDSAFRYCTGLAGKVIELPKSVRTLENNVFANIGSSDSPFTIYVYNQNINIAETTDKTLPIGDKYYCNPFYWSYINLYAFMYDDNGDDTFITKYQKVFNNVYQDSTSMALTLMGLDKTEYSHKVYGSVPEDAVVYVKKDGFDYVQVANNNGLFEQQVTEGNNVFVKVSLEGHYDKYFMKLDTDYTSDWKVCEITVNDFEETPVTGTMEIKLSRTDNENLVIERSRLNYNLYWNEQKLVEGTDYTVQLPNIYITKAEIGEEDELTLQVVPDGSQAFVTSTAVSTKKNGTFDVKMIPWGSINANVTGSFAGYNNILIFDEAGNLYRSLSQPNGAYTLSEIRKGTYTVAAYNTNSYFSSVNTLSALNDIGLQNGTDYVSAEIQVSDGNITDVDLTVPLLSVASFARYVDTENSNVIIESSDIITGQLFKARVNYSLIGSTVGTIRFMLPADAKVSYIYNGNEKVAFTDGEGYCDVSVTDAKGTIYVQMSVSDTGSHMLGASFISNGIVVPIGSAVFDTEALSIRTSGDTISSQSEYVNVYTTPYTSVSLYLGDNEEPIIGTTNAVGRVRFNFTGPSNLKLYDEYTIRAVTDTGSKEYTYKFYPKDAVIKKMGFNYLGKDHDVIINDIDQNPNYIYAQEIHPTDYDVNGGVYWTFYTTLESSYEIDEASIQIFMMDDTYIMVPMTLTESKNNADGTNEYSFSATKWLEKVNGTSAVPHKFMVHYAFADDTEFDADITDKSIEDEVANADAFVEGVNAAIEGDGIEDLNDINSELGNLFDQFALIIDTDMTKEEYLLNTENIDIGEVFFNNSYKITTDEWFEDIPQDGKEIMIQYEESLNDLSDYLSEIFSLPKSFNEYGSWDEVYEDMGYTVDDTKTINDYTEEELSDMGYALSENKSYAYRLVDEKNKIAVGNKDADIVSTFARRSSTGHGYSEVIDGRGTHTFTELSPKPSEAMGDMIDKGVGELADIVGSNGKNLVKWLSKHPDVAKQIQDIFKVANNASVARFLSGTLANIIGSGLNVKSYLDLWNKYIAAEDQLLDIQDEIDRIKRLRIKYAGISVEDGCFLGNLKLRANCLTSLDWLIDNLNKQKDAITFYKYNLQDEFWTNIASLIISKFGPLAAGVTKGYSFAFGLFNDYRKDMNRKNADFYGKLALENYVSADFNCGAADNYGTKGSPCDGEDGNQEGGNVVSTGSESRSRNTVNGRSLSAANPALDPSGNVYEAVESNTIEGVTATIWYSENSDGSDAVIWNAEEWDQINPQITDKDGFYQWDVPTGYYQVVFEKEGYQTTRTEWLPVPPPQMNLKNAMVSTKAPQIETVKAYKGYVEISFDQYMDTEAELDVNGYTYEWQDIDSGYSKVLRFIYSGTAKENGDTVSFALRGAKNYAGTALPDYESGSLTVETRPADIKTNFASIVTFEVGEDTSFTVRVVDEDGNLMEGVKVSATVKEDAFATVGEAELTSEDGKTMMPIKALAPGMTDITFKVDGTALTRTYKLFISDGNNQPLRPTAKVGETELDESSPKENYVNVVYGDKLILNCATEGVKIYYTTNDTCPCQDTPDRHEYTGPVTLTENTYFRIAAYKDGMEYSDRLNITVTVHKHEYGTPEFTWAADGKSATATFTCECGDTFTEKATVTSSVEKAATYTVKGTTKYTAKVVYDGITYTATKSVQNIAKKTLTAPNTTSITNGANGITIKYSKVTGADSYIIYRKVGTGQWTKYKTTTALSFTDTAATAAKTIYRYKVSAYHKDSAGEVQSSSSSAVSIVRVGASKIKSVENDTKGIKIKWSKVTGATGYYLYRSVNGGAYKKYKTIKGATKVSYTDTGAKTNGAKYAYKIVAYRTDGGKTYKSAESSAVVTYRLKASVLSKAVNSARKTVTLTWSKNTKATGYVVKYVTGKKTKTVKVTNSKATKLTKKLTGLAKGKKYKISIRAYKKVGKTTYWSAWSNTKSVAVKR